MENIKLLISYKKILSNENNKIKEKTKISEKKWTWMEKRWSSWQNTNSIRYLDCWVKKRFRKNLKNNSGFVAFPIE